MTNPNVYPADGPVFFAPEQGIPAEPVLPAYSDPGYQPADGTFLSEPEMPSEPVLPAYSDPIYQPADRILAEPAMPAEPALPRYSDSGYQPADGAFMSEPAMPAEPGIALGDRIEGLPAGSEPADYDPATPLEMGERVEAPLAPMQMGERVEAPLAGREPAQFDPATPALPAQPRRAMRSVGPEDEAEPRAYESTGPDASKSTRPGAYKSNPAPGSDDSDSGDSGYTLGTASGSGYHAPIRVDTEIMAAGLPVVRGLASDLGETGRVLDGGISALQLGGDDEYGKQYRASGVPMTQQLLTGISGAASTLDYAGDNTVRSVDGFTGTEAGATDIARGVSS